MGLLNAPLEDLVFEFLRADVVVANYNKGFFDTLTAYSFEKTHLKMDEHFRPYVHVTGVLDGFAKNRPSLAMGAAMLSDPAKRIESFDDSDALLSFCDTVLFFSGLFPEAFKKRTVPINYYNQLAKKGFQKLHLRATRDSYFRQMGDYFDRYVGALSFMKNKLLADSFEHKEDELIN
jgi:hypothetical protein